MAHLFNILQLMIIITNKNYINIMEELTIIVNSDNK